MVEVFAATAAPEPEEAEDKHACANDDGSDERRDNGNSSAAGESVPPVLEAARLRNFFNGFRFSPAKVLALISIRPRKCTYSTTLMLCQLPDLSVHWYSLADV